MLITDNSVSFRKKTPPKLIEIIISVRGDTVITEKQLDLNDRKI